MAEPARHRDARSAAAHDESVLRRVVIEIGGPGLGDSLSYSTLPKELIEQGRADEVIIREPRAGWRNPEVRALFERDMFVSGFTTTEPSTNFRRHLPHRSPRSFSSGHRSAAIPLSTSLARYERISIGQPAASVSAFSQNVRHCLRR